MHINIVQYCYHESPIGKLLLAGHQDVLYLIGFPEGTLSHPVEPNWVHNPQAFNLHKQQLTEYFQGVRKNFDAPIALTGTKFQQNVLQMVGKIPYGTTKSYGDIAKQINNPRAVRAVGGANAKNPLPIIIPCHRVIGKNGALTGFGGGLDVKSRLLHLEGVSCHTL